MSFPKLFFFLFSFSSLFGVDTIEQFNAAKAKCEAGNGAACARMYYYYVPTRHTFVPGITLDLRKALFYAQKACELNDEDGCFFSGMTLYYGDEWAKIERDRARGKAYIQKACQLGKEDVCSHFP